MRARLYATVARVSKRRPLFWSCIAFQRQLATFGSSDSEDAVTDLLHAVQRGRLSVSEAQNCITKLKDDGFQIDYYANLDLRRSRRVGFPEAVFAQGKTPLQVAEILDRMAAASEAAHASPILATR